MDNVSGAENCTELEKFFLKEMPVNILVAIRRSREDICVSDCSRKVDTTYAHAVKTRKKLEETHDLVCSREDGRKQVLELTDEGKRIADIFIELKQEFSGEVGEEELTLSVP